MRHYLTSTFSYWVFTLTDGALRMLVVLHFHQLGYDPLAIASLFLFYELFGMVTNLLGGLLASRIGLAHTQTIGALLQCLGLGLLLGGNGFEIWVVMLAQALSGIAKDLTKLAAKSSVKFIATDPEEQVLYRAVAWLTGSKNLLKGAGFFLGGLLLSLQGFEGAIGSLLGLLVVPLLLGLWGFDRNLGRSAFRPKFTELFSKSPEINWLSGARCMLFGARDVWFVVALPVYLQTALGWNNSAVGSLLALWVIGYGGIQMLAPKLTGGRTQRAPTARSNLRWGLPLIFLPLMIALVLPWALSVSQHRAGAVLVLGLATFGALFAVNAAIHSYLIVRYADRNGVSLDVGFYYMSNAAGRLLGTLLSGAIYQLAGLPACLIASAAMLALATAAAAQLQRVEGNNALS